MSDWKDTETARSPDGETEHFLLVEGTGYIHQRMSLNQNGHHEVQSEEVISRKYAQRVRCSCGETYEGVQEAKRHLNFARAYYNDEVMIVEGMIIRDGEGRSMEAVNEGSAGWEWEHSEADNLTIGPDAEEIQQGINENGWTVEYPNEMTESL